MTRRTTNLVIIAVLCFGMSILYYNYQSHFKTTQKLWYIRSKSHVNKLVTGHVPTKEVDLRLIVIVYNRPQSLQKCLDSMNTIDFLGDRVALDIWIDRSAKTGEIHSDTFTVAKHFHFLHGEATVHNQSKHVGITGQWMDSWNISSTSKERAIIFEDDLTAGPYVWKWFKAAVKKYGGRPDVAGFSFTNQKLVASTGGSDLSIPLKYNVYMYRVLGTWGFAPEAKSWIEMRNFHHKKMVTDKSFVPSIPGTVLDVWWKTLSAAGRQESMWEIWHVYWTNKKGLYTVYSNLPNREGLAINRKEVGLHQGASDPRPEDPLCTKWSEDYIKFPKVPVKIGYNGKVEKEPEF